MREPEPVSEIALPAGRSRGAPASRFTWVLLMLGALLLGSAWILYSREAPDTGNIAGLTEAPAVGHLAPDFTLDTLTGDSFSLSATRGQPVILNFWATWCPPCRVEIPHFQEASTAYNGQVLIVGVDDGEPRAQVAPFAQEMGITYPVPLDSNSEVARRYRVNSLPTTFFIDADGVIQHIQIGLVNGAMLAEQVERLIRDS